MRGGKYKPPIIKNSWGGGLHVFMFYEWRMQNYVCLEYISFLSLSLDIIVPSLIMSEKRIKTDLCKQKQFLINNEQTKHFCCLQTDLEFLKLGTKSRCMDSSAYKEGVTTLYLKLSVRLISSDL